ncbi:hypothetical protein C8R45DRAFT_1112842 [Mycena sanguinolenta]|nr:hypothetical protein C8R45DRAFT_1112842 [Mycena sanguinolenta]
MLQSIFRMNEPKKRRAHHEIELFQMRNPEIINTALKNAGYDLLNTPGDPDEPDDWTDESEDTPAARLKRTKSKRMLMRTRITRDLLMEASEEERESIRQEVEAEKKKLREEALALEERKNLKSMTPTERQQGIDGLDGLISNVHRATYLASGWVGMTIIGGPNPRMNGDLTLKVICFGETPGGNDFEACCVDFDKHLIQPFQDYLRLCFNDEDTSALALPTASETADDDTSPVYRIATAEPVEEPEKVKKSKSKKSKAKSKRLKTKAPKDTDVAANPDEDPGTVTETNESDVFLDSASPDGEIVFENQIADLQQDFEMDDPVPNVPDVNVTPGGAWSPWPVGMTAPLSPDAAAAITSIEGGAVTNGPTMAIDPQLINLSATSTFTPSPSTAPAPLPVSSPALPKPKPAWKGSGSAYRPSALFEAFRGGRKTPPPPHTPVPINIPASLTTTPTSWSPPLLSKSTPSSSASLLLSRSTNAVQLVSSIINTHVPANPSTPPAVMPSTPAVTASPISTPPPGAASSSSVPAPPANLSTPPAVMPSTPAVTAPPVSTPPPGIASSSSVLAPPIVPTHPQFVLPGSRPEVRPPPPHARPAAKAPRAKQGNAKQAQRRKGSSAKASSKAGAAVEAKRVASLQDVAKKRGRPRKQPLTEITNEVVSAVVPPSPPVDPATSTTPPATASTSPVYIVSSTNNNRVAARQAAEREKAAAEKVAADAAAAQAAKGWTERTVDGATVVTFTSTRIRRSAKHPDGSDVQPATKTTRAPATEKTDASVTKLLERGMKRKAEQSSDSKGKSKKRKT